MIVVWAAGCGLTGFQPRSMGSACIGPDAPLFLVYLDHRRKKTLKLFLLGGLRAATEWPTVVPDGQLRERRVETEGGYEGTETSESKIVVH
mmetsp:Transcript_988/g.1823  ORF Transcript_988/g.1823 Transcript_988/m.1823 type:complete len:91 (+) Transcript_988:371-643(+)